MHSSSSLPYHTSMLKMSKVNFECMVNNLNERIRKMNFQLYFKTKNEMDNFITAAKRAEEREGPEMQLSSEQEDKNQEEKEEVAIGGERVKIEEGVDIVVIEQTFQKSILLRMHFMERLRDIEDRLKVKFMVVPQRVKISGCSRNRVEEAQEQYSELVNQICLEPIDRFGREVFLSRRFRAKLQEGKVHLVEILKKYYFWFLKSEAKEPQQILQSVFFRTKHALYPLRKVSFREKEQLLAGGKGTVVLGDVSFGRGGQRSTHQLFVLLRARLFESVISLRLNQMEDREERQVQLAEDRKSLILHMDAEEQLEIQTQTIQEQYSRFEFLYLVFPDNVDMLQVANTLNASPPFSGGFKKDKARQDLLIWQLNERYLCLAFTKQKKEFSIEEKIATHPLTYIINTLPLALCNFKLGMFEVFQLPETEQWAKLTAQRDKIQRLTLIGVKSCTKANLQRLARLLVEGKLSAEKFAKAKEQKIDKGNVQMDVSIDMSRQINESTQLLIMNNVSREEENKLDISISEIGKQVLTSELVSKKFSFEGYSFFLQEQASEREKKFASDVDIPTKENRPFNKEDYIKKLQETTSFKFKLFRVKLPKKSSEVNLQDEASKILEIRPQLGHLNRWITVFCGSKLQDLGEAGKLVKVLKVQKNHKIKEGWLLTTNPLFLFLSDSEELPSHHYEPLCFCKKLE